jgi:zinc transport system substrate-binding protein
MKKALLLLCLTALIFTFSCGKKSAPSQSSKPLVLVSISPYRYFVEKVGGDQIQVEAIVPQGADAHSFEPAPKQLAQIRSSALWFRIGEPFEKQVIDLANGLCLALGTVDLRDGIDLLDEPDHHCPHCGIDHKDRHIWMSPKLAKQQANQIAEALSKRFPESAPFFQANLAALSQELDALDREILEILSPVQDRVILASHPSFGYFCRDYGFEQLSVEHEGKDPRPRQLEHLIEEARAKHAEVAFALPQYNNKGAQMVAQELHLPVRLINPYSSDYPATLRTLAHMIADPYNKERHETSSR